MDRRTFVVTAAAGGGLAVFGLLSWPTSVRAADSPWGPLQPPDDNGIALPEGFTSRVLATTGQPVGPSDYEWHPNPDGGATFALPDGGWVYVSNDESSNGNGGVSMLRFDDQGQVIEAGQILSGTNRNCAGGPTPWQTWLSCEEVDDGLVWECDPLGRSEAVVHPQMGRFNHEAAACDPTNQVVYLTEDKGDGALYRYVPDEWGDLRSGQLEVLRSDLSWAAVPDPSADSAPTRTQVEDTLRFNGGEGAWFEDGLLWFTTKGDNRVWKYDAAASTLDVVYDWSSAADPVLSGVDNIVAGPTGDLFVCEDGGNMEVVIVTPTGDVAPFLRVDVERSELTGVAFDPSGQRMYVSSQRNPGRTYEITGPFAPEPPTAPLAVEFVG